jgi:hypothetical protein
LCRDAGKADADTVLQTIKFASGSPMSSGDAFSVAITAGARLRRGKCGHLTGWPP